VRWRRGRDGSQDRYKHGDFNRICDRSGFKVKASETRREWTGRIVRVEDWEPRHPQDFVRARPDHQSVAFPRPEPASDTFLNPNEVNPGDLESPFDNLRVTSAGDQRRVAGGVRKVLP
jgi:hypothetical protein